MIYLASPYSDPSPIVRQHRHDLVEAFVARNLGKLYIFSPIVYAHEMSLNHNIPGDAQTWAQFNLHFLRKCDAMWILQLQGWKESKGVAMELKWADELALPITYISCE